MRRLVLRTLMLSLLAIGIASAARVKHTVDLPTNPLHWQRYLKQLRSILATQRLSLRYDVPVPAPGSGTDAKYADSEDYFRAGPTYNRPDGIPPSIWTSLKTLIYTVVFMGIPTGHGVEGLS